MATAIYTVDSDASRVVATATSSVHDTSATLGPMSGTIEADVDALGEEGKVSLSIEVDLTTADAGDFLRTRKLRGDIDARRYPRATFAITRVVDLTREDDGRFQATGEGILSWRDRELEIRPSGSGRIDARRVEATATFSLDIRDFGVEPPKFLMLKVDPVVSVEVSLVAVAR